MPLAPQGQRSGSARSKLYLHFGFGFRDAVARTGEDPHVGGLLGLGGKVDVDQTGVRVGNRRGGGGGGRLKVRHGRGGARGGSRFGVGLGWSAAVWPVFPVGAGGQPAAAL